MATDQSLTLFLSSKNNELISEQRAIQAALPQHRMCGRLWKDNVDMGSYSEATHSKYLTEIATCDIYIGLFWLSYSEEIIEEFKYARTQQKPCLIYEKHVDADQRDQRLKAFLDHIQYAEDTDNIYLGNFQTLEELVERVKNDVIKLLKRVLQNNNLEQTTSISTASSVLLNTEKGGIASYNNPGIIKQINYIQLPISNITIIDLFVISKNKINDYKIKDITNIVLQQRRILETTSDELISETAIELQQPPKLRAALKALRQAEERSEVQLAIAQHPILLSDEALEVLTMMINEHEQFDSTMAAKRLRLRLDEVHFYRQQRAQEINNTNPEQTDHSKKAKTYRTNLTASRMVDGITQLITQIESYIPPAKQWQPSRYQTLDKTFVGRQEELTILAKYLTSGKNVTITGETRAESFQSAGGIGKTYLARKLAIELGTSFPNSILWIDMGSQVTNEVSSQIPLSKLASFAFGGVQPTGQLKPEKVAAWLKETAPDRLLVIFDDLWHQEPLHYLKRALPTDTTILVTTRFTNIAYALGGHTLTLGNLSIQDGLSLIGFLLNCQGDMNYRDDLEKLVILLKGHVLALELIAAQIKKPSTIRIRTMIDNLHQRIGQRNIMDLKLTLNEEREENLEKSLAVSYERMTDEHKRCFRALGVFSTETPITVEAAASVWGMNRLNTAQNILFDLADLALVTEIEEPAGNTYCQHGILHMYAHALLDKENELTFVSQAQADYYKSMVLLVESSNPKNYPLLDRYIQNLLTALHWSVDHAPALFAELLEVSSQYLRLRGQWALLEKYLPKAAMAAAQIDNKILQAKLLQIQGDLENRLGNLDQARSYYDEALRLLDSNSG